jgi:hypothetical protein
VLNGTIIPSLSLSKLSFYLKAWMDGDRMSAEIKVWYVAAFVLETRLKSTGPWRHGRPWEAVADDCRHCFVRACFFAAVSIHGILTTSALAALSYLFHTLGDNTMVDVYQTAGQICGTARQLFLWRIDCYAALRF